MHVWLIAEKIDADIKHEITGVLGAAGTAFCLLGYLNVHAHGLDKPPTLQAKRRAVSWAMRNEVFYHESAGAPTLKDWVLRRFLVKRRCLWHLL